MTAIVHPSESRGIGDHGWLYARHSFSFAQYHDPARMRFGLLRVLNDDVVAPGMGFDTHPHRNMEIITIPLAGVLAHKDSMGHQRTLKPGEVQVMSAGSGLTHSEYNGSENEPVNLLQIWIFPKIKDITPAYDQKFYPVEGRRNQWQMLASADGQDESLQINQDAWIARVDLSKDQSITASVHAPEHGLYVFVIKGEVTVNDQALGERDAVGLVIGKNVVITAQADAQVLCIEVPMS